MVTPENAFPLSVENVSLSYGTVKAIDAIDLSVKSGEIFGLMGLNGAGKTSLIKAVLGLRNQDSGTIKIYGADHQNEGVKKRLAYLPEKFEPPWFLSGMEFLKFSLRLYGKEYDVDMIMAAAREVALDEGALKRRVQTYSKGMRQKLGLLGTVLTGAPFLILDEPMSGLDPMARALVKKMLLDVKERGHTIFLSSHILADMDEICDRVALLHDTQIQYVGSPEGLKEAQGRDNLEQAFLHFIEKRKAA